MRCIIRGDEELSGRKRLQCTITLARIVAGTG